MKDTPVYKMEDEASLARGLVRASVYGDISAMLLYLEKTHPDCYTGQRFTALIAAAGTSLEAVKLLISRGANPHLRTEYENSPLKAAAAHRKTDIIQYLLSIGVDPNYASHGEVALTILVDRVCSNTEYGHPTSSDEMAAIEALMRVTSPDWHQAAYTCATDVTIRNFIKELSPCELTEPPAFGGPYHNDTKFFRKIPSHPLSREIWILAHLCAPEDDNDDTYDWDDVFWLHQLVRHVKRHKIDNPRDINEGENALYSICRHMRNDERRLSPVSRPLLLATGDKYAGQRTRSGLFRNHCPKLFVAPENLKNNENG